MKRVEIEIVEGTRDDGSRLRRVAEILAGGVYEFLEEGGYLKEAEGDETSPADGSGPAEGDDRKKRDSDAGALLAFTGRLESGRGG